MLLELQREQQVSEESYRIPFVCPVWWWAFVFFYREFTPLLPRRVSGFLFSLLFGRKHHLCNFPSLSFWFGSMPICSAGAIDDGMAQLSISFSRPQRPTHKVTLILVEFLRFLRICGVRGQNGKVIKIVSCWMKQTNKILKIIKYNLN